MRISGLPEGTQAVEVRIVTTRGETGVAVAHDESKR
jgi:hypothetical protein